MPTTLSPGEVELLIDGLTDAVMFVGVLIHLGIRGNPSPEPGPPSPAEVDLAFTTLGRLSGEGLVKVGRLEYLDDGLPGRAAPTRHVQEPFDEARARVAEACRLGTDWEWSCWVVNTPKGDAQAIQNPAMSVAPRDLIEELVDPLLMGSLAERYPHVQIEWVADNQIVIDFGLPGGDFVLTVDARPRQG